MQMASHRKAGVSAAIVLASLAIASCSQRPEEQPVDTASDAAAEYSDAAGDAAAPAAGADADNGGGYAAAADAAGDAAAGAAAVDGGVDYGADVAADAAADAVAAAGDAAADKDGDYAAAAADAAGDAAAAAAAPNVDADYPAAAAAAPDVAAAAIGDAADKDGELAAAAEDAAGDAATAAANAADDATATYPMVPGDGTPEPRPAAVPSTGPIPSDVDDTLATHELVDEELDAMGLGSIAFNAPRHMNFEQTAEVHLLLSMTKSIEDLQVELTEPGERTGAQIRVSRVMEAALTGANFQITAITPEAQAITGQDNTAWRWEVIPKRSGLQELHLTMTAFVDVDGKSIKRAVRTFDHTIEVNVTFGQRAAGLLREHWTWMWGAILVPVVGWLFNKRRTRGTGRKVD